MLLSESERAGLMPPSDTIEEVWGVANIAELENAARFLERSGLSFEELEELINVPFFKESEPETGEPLLDVVRGEDPCDFSDFTITGLDESLLDRIHRFLRLARKLNWTITDLGIVLTTMGHMDISAEVLNDIARIVRLAQIYRLSPAKIVSLEGEALSEALRTPAGDLALFDRLTDPPPPPGSPPSPPRSKTEQARRRLELLEQW